jgi:hypothetical protein
MEPTREGQKETEPLVELAPDEAVLRALSQSAHPVEWTEANPTDDDDEAAESHDS